MRPSQLVCLLAFTALASACQDDPCPTPGAGPVAYFLASPDDDMSQAEAWLHTPSPSAHRTVDGAPDWSEFPDPYRVALLDDYLDILRDTDGFGLSAPIFVRFDSSLSDSSILPQPATTQSATDSIQLVDITPSSPEYGRRRPVRWQWWPNEQTYLPDNTLSVAPAWGFPLRQATTYALILTDKLTGSNGKAIQAPGLMKAVLRGESKDACSDTEGPSSLLAAYLPLREYLANQDGLTERIAVATVFTTQSFGSELTAIYEAISNEGPTYTPSTWRALGDAGELWEEKTFKWTRQATTRYFLMEGRLTIPNYQAGSIPYDKEGQLNIVDGQATPVSQDNIRFTLTIPAEPSANNGGCYPIVEYAHGTGGSAYSLDSDTAGRLAARGLAGISIDMPLHGERTGGRTFDVNTASFNFINPSSARSMFRQAAIDTFSLTAFINNGLRVEPESSPTGQEICFDASKIGFFGHSQGGLSGSIAAAYESGIDAWVFSGAGGGLGITIQERKDFADFEELVKFLLQIPEEEEVSELHPIHQVIQSTVEITDPINYAPLWGAQAVNSSASAPNVLMTSGCLDEQTPYRSSNALALAAEVPLLKPAAVEIPAYQWLGLPYEDAPVSSNSPDGATQGYLQWCGAITRPGESNHFVIFNRPEAIHASMFFLETWAYGEAPIIERDEESSAR